MCRKKSIGKNEPFWQNVMDQFSVDQISYVVDILTMDVFTEYEYYDIIMIMICN